MNILTFDEMQAALRDRYAEDVREFPEELIIGDRPRFSVMFGQPEFVTCKNQNEWACEIEICQKKLYVPEALNFSFG